MEIIKEKFISEVSQLISSRDYQEIIAEFQKEIDERQGKVLANYLNDIPYAENQIYNEKNATVEKIKIMLFVKDRFEKISLVGKQYIIDEIDSTLELANTNIKNNVGWLNTGLTMSVYTESDLELIGANALADFITYYDKKIEEYKNQAKDDTTLSEVKED